MFISLPESSTQYGFLVNAGGAINSRTIMVDELRQLLAVCASDASFALYRQAIIDDNALGKPTLATRIETFKRLRQFYGLDQRILLFGVLRDLWTVAESQPLLASLCALARDHLFRATIPVILDAAFDASVAPEMFAEPVAAEFPGRYAATTLRTIGWNAASSWQQSGHLVGKPMKRRAYVHSSPEALTFALLLGYLCDVRGEKLFATPWVRLLDTQTDALFEQAFAASRGGWLTFRHTGGVVDIDFRALLEGPGRTRR